MNPQCEMCQREAPVVEVRYPLDAEYTRRVCWQCYADIRKQAQEQANASAAEHTEGERE